MVDVIQREGKIRTDTARCRLRRHLDLFMPVGVDGFKNKHLHLTDINRCILWME